METAPVTTRSRMSLDAITKGPTRAPQRIVIYGTEGIGKSTFASHAASVIWLPIEEGANALDVARLPRVLGWADVIDALDMLAREEHSYRTIVIDTLDALEPIVWKRTCATRLTDANKKVASIEDYGYAKGYVYALEFWGELLARLDVLREQKGMDVILVAHAALVTIKSPDTEDWQRYDLKMHHKASALVREWADHVLFATNQLGMSVLNKRTKVTSLGERVLHTVSAAGWSAKTRSNAPPELALSYAAWTEATAAPETGEAIIARIDAALVSVPEDKHPKVREAIAAALVASDSLGRLRAIENRLSLTINKESAS